MSSLIALKRAEDFFTDPQQINLDIASIQQECQGASDATAFDQLCAWSELNGQVFGAEIPRSRFAKLLAEDPAMAARCEEIVQRLRAAAADDVAAGERAQRIGPGDLDIVIY